MSSPAAAVAAGNATAAPLGPRTKLEPLSADSFALHGTIRRSTHDLMERARCLLGHPVRGNDLNGLLYRAFDALVRELERKKFGIVDRPRARKPRPSANPRRIPAEVKRAVVARDGGRCTFTSESGRRCEAREHLEFDHVVSVAQGGEATVGNVRLLCREHNQLAAERTFGADYVRHRRIAAREASERRKRESEARVKAEIERGARAAAERAAVEAERDRADDAARARDAAIDEVVPWLRALRLGKDEARRAAAFAWDQLPDAPLEQRVRLALRSLARSRPVPPPRAGAAPSARALPATPAPGAPASP